MKKTILSIVIALSSIILAKAQLYVGGSLSLNMSSQKVENVDNSTNPSYYFSISPEIGYSLNKKIDIGVMLSALFSSSKQANIGIDIENNLRVGGIGEIKSKNFEVAPYIRYSFLKWRKFNVLGMANIYVNTGKTEYNSVYSYDYEYESGSGSVYSESKSKMESTAWGIRIRPVLQYSFSDKFLLLSQLNLFRLGFSQQRNKTMFNLEGAEYTRITTGFDLGIDTYNILPSIGFIYKF